MDHFTINNFLLLGSIMLLLSVAVSRLSSKHGVPALLLFLLVGILFGKSGFGLNFDGIEQTQFIGRITLSLILFSGGLDTRINDIRPVLLPGLVLSTLGVILTTLFVGVFIFEITNIFWPDVFLPLSSSLLLAAAMSSTDSTAGFTVLRQKDLTLKQPIRPILELESGSNDPTAYILTLALMNVVTANTSDAIEMDIASLVFIFIRQFIFGFLLGCIISKVTIHILRKKDSINRDLYSVMFIGLLYFTFSFTELLGGNGYLAIYVSGVLIGNSDIPRLANIKKFIGALAWLAQIVVFICLGLLVDIDEMLNVAFVSIVVALFMMLVGRPLSVFISLAPFKKLFDTKSKWFISWVGFRGAAAVIFAVGPVLVGVEKSNIIFNIVFFITFLSLLIKGFTVKKYAEFLGLTVDNDDDTDEKAYSELSEGLGHPVQKKVLTEEDFAEGDKLSAMSIGKDMLVIMLRRDKKYLVPHADFVLKPGDVMLMVRKYKESEPSTVIEIPGGGKSSFLPWD